MIRRVLVSGLRGEVLRVLLNRKLSVLMKLNYLLFAIAKRYLIELHASGVASEKFIHGIKDLREARNSCDFLVYEVEQRIQGPSIKVLANI